MTNREIGEFFRGLQDRVRGRQGPSSGRKDKRQGERRSVLAIRTHLAQIDLFCYLKARFGEPNGFQNYLRKKDDSDNLIHWEYQLRAGDVYINIGGANRETHFVITEPLSDADWQSMILSIKADYRRIGPDKSQILRALEKWVVFPNKYVQIADVCTKLHETITDNIIGYQVYRPNSASTRKDTKSRYKALALLSQRAEKLYGACLQLSCSLPCWRRRS